jgi:hypothetical protein
MLKKLEHQLNVLLVLPELLYSQTGAQGEYVV